MALKWNLIKKKNVSFENDSKCLMNRLSKQFNDSQHTCCSLLELIFLENKFKTLIKLCTLLVTYFKKCNFHIFLIHYMHIFFLILMIRAYSWWKSKISISKYENIYIWVSINDIQYKLCVYLVLWKHNNGEHCWLGNGPEDDHWHPPHRE